MNESYRNLNEDDILFSIEIEPTNKFFGLNGMISISGKFPPNVNILVSKICSDSCKFICFTKNNSDLKTISENYEVKVKEI